MATINESGKGSGKRGKPNRMNLRVDFTPMVDMNMLLITFFMFCTSLSKPQVMDIVMPTKIPDSELPDLMTQVPDSKAVTLILGEGDKVYYYFGQPDYEDYMSLKETDYSQAGLRAILLERNKEQVAEVVNLRKQKSNKSLSDEDYKQQMLSAKNSKNGVVVIIKPTDASSYRNLVEALDEMQLCSIGKYAIVEMTDGDDYLVENYKTRGQLSAQALSLKK